jgi:hypothetical protein
VTADEPPSFIGEDASALSVVVPGVEWRWRVTVNGLPHSWLPYEGIHTLLGAVPALIHPAPEDVAVVGLGSGETAWAVACRGDGPRLRMRPAGPAPARGERRGAVRFPSCSSSPTRGSRSAADGRQLARSSERYDVVQVDAMFHERGDGPLAQFFRRARVGSPQDRARRSRAASGLTAEALPHAVGFNT